MAFLTLAIELAATYFRQIAMIEGSCRMPAMPADSCEIGESGVEG
jgi:hypothetical protein